MRRRYSSRPCLTITSRRVPNSSSVRTTRGRSTGLTSGVGALSSISLGDDLHLRRVVEVVDEHVCARRWRADADVHDLAGGHDLLDAQILVLDLDRLFRIVVG